MNYLTIDMLIALERMTRQLVDLANQSEWDAVQQLDAERMQLLSQQGTDVAANEPAQPNPATTCRANQGKHHATDSSPTEQRQALIRAIEEQDARLLKIMRHARDSLARQSTRQRAQQSAQRHYQTARSW